MRKILSIIFGFIVVCTSVQAQNENYRIVDSLVIRPAAARDSSLIGKNIFNIMPKRAKGNSANVYIHQSKAIIDAFNNAVEENKQRQINGFRVRIFFDNKQSARSASEAALTRFKAMYPGISAYRSYENMFFKVTVGDFRTKAEATQLLQELKMAFPSAFILKGPIKYPVVDKENAYIVDTLRIVRQINR